MLTVLTESGRIVQAYDLKNPYLQPRTKILSKDGMTETKAVAFARYGVLAGIVRRGLNDASRVCVQEASPRIQGFHGPIVHGMAPTF